MKIKCKCGNIVANGEIGRDKKGRKVFHIEGNCQGEIWKQSSKNPEDWIGVCSKCQPKLSKKKKNK